MGNVRQKPPRRSTEDVAKLLLSDSKPSADAEGLLRAFMDEIGGERELARIFARQLRDPEISAQTKQRLLDTIQRLVIMCTQHNLSKEVEPSEMTNEDLERVTLSLLSKVQHGRPAGASP